MVKPERIFTRLPNQSLDLQVVYVDGKEIGEIYANHNKGIFIFSANVHCPMGIAAIEKITFSSRVLLKQALKVMILATGKVTTFDGAKWK